MTRRIGRTADRLNGRLVERRRGGRGPGHRVVRRDRGRSTGPHGVRPYRKPDCPTALRNGRPTWRPSEKDAVSGGRAAGPPPGVVAPRIGCPERWPGRTAASDGHARRPSGGRLYQVALRCGGRAEQAPVAVAAQDGCPTWRSRKTSSDAALNEGRPSRWPRKTVAGRGGQARGPSAATTEPGPESITDLGPPRPGRPPTPRRGPGADHRPRAARPRLFPQPRVTPRPRPDSWGRPVGQGGAASMTFGRGAAASTAPTRSPSLSKGRRCSTRDAPSGPC